MSQLQYHTCRVALPGPFKSEWFTITKSKPVLIQVDDVFRCVQDIPLFFLNKKWASFLRANAHVRDECTMLQFIAPGAGRDTATLKEVPFDTRAGVCFCTAKGLESLFHEFLSRERGLNVMIRQGRLNSLRDELHPQLTQFMRSTASPSHPDVPSMVGRGRSKQSSAQTTTTNDSSDDSNNDSDDSDDSSDDERPGRQDQQGTPAVPAVPTTPDAERYTTIHYTYHKIQCTDYSGYRVRITQSNPVLMSLDDIVRLVVFLPAARRRLIDRFLRVAAPAGHYAQLAPAPGPLHFLRDMYETTARLSVINERERGTLPLRTESEIYCDATAMKVFLLNFVQRDHVAQRIVPAIHQRLFASRLAPWVQLSLAYLHTRCLLETAVPSLQSGQPVHPIITMDFGKDSNDTDDSDDSDASDESSDGSSDDNAQPPPRKRVATGEAKGTSGARSGSSGDNRASSAQSKWQTIDDLSARLIKVEDELEQEHNHAVQKTFTLVRDSLIAEIERLCKSS